jgi:hypothetical protein
MQTNDSILNESELNEHVAGLALASESSNKRQRVSFEPTQGKYIFLKILSFHKILQQDVFAHFKFYL